MTRIIRNLEIDADRDNTESGFGALQTERGCLPLVAMDILPASVETVWERVRAADLKNVRVLEGDALNTELDDESMDAVLLFGVIPTPMLPLDQLLPEMHRILRPGGIMAVWPQSWVRQSIPQSALFTFVRKRNGVLNFQRI